MSEGWTEWVKAGGLTALVPLQWCLGMRSKEFQSCKYYRWFLFNKKRQHYRKYSLQTVRDIAYQKKRALKGIVHSLLAPMKAFSQHKRGFLRADPRQFGEDPKSGIEQTSTTTNTSQRESRYTRFWHLYEILRSNFIYITGVISVIINIP